MTLSVTRGRRCNGLMRYGILYNICSLTTARQCSKLVVVCTLCVLLFGCVVSVSHMYCCESLVWMALPLGIWVVFGITGFHFMYTLEFAITTCTSAAICSTHMQYVGEDGISVHDAFPVSTQRHLELHLACLWGNERCHMLTESRRSNHHYPPHPPDRWLSSSRSGRD